MASLTKLARVERPLEAQEGRMLSAMSDRMLPTSSMQDPMPSTRYVKAFRIQVTHSLRTLMKFSTPFTTAPIICREA